MSWEQVLTLVLVGYGALLSTALASGEWWKGRRRVQIRLDYVAFVELAEVPITNKGFRPVTITGLYVHPEGSDMVPSNSKLSTRVEPTRTLPATLGDGDHITLPLSDTVSRKLSHNGMKTYIGVYDAEGRTRMKHKVGQRNPKWGYHGNR